MYKWFNKTKVIQIYYLLYQLVMGYHRDNVVIIGKWTQVL